MVKRIITYLFYLLAMIGIVEFLYVSNNSNLYAFFGFGIFFVLTIVVYFFISIFIKIDNVLDLITDIVLFLALNIVGFGLDIAMLSFFPFSIPQILLNLFLSIIYMISFFLRIFGNRIRLNAKIA